MRNGGTVAALFNHASKSGAQNVRYEHDGEIVLIGELASEV